MWDGCSLDHLPTILSGYFSVLEQRIRELCERLIDTNDAEELQRVSAELQCLLHAHIEHLRSELEKVPTIVPPIIAA